MLLARSSAGGAHRRRAAGRRDDVLDHQGFVFVFTLTPILMHGAIDDESARHSMAA